MKRRLLNLLTLLSLLLCAAVAALWVRSYRALDRIDVVETNAEAEGDHGFLWRYWGVASTRGTIRVYFAEEEDRDFDGHNSLWNMPHDWSIRHQSEGALD